MFQREDPKGSGPEVRTDGVRWLDEPPGQCDVCQGPLAEVFFDVKTASGAWGFLCEPCHGEHGLGVGLGSGQKYVKEGGEFVCVAGAEMAERRDE